MKFAFLERLRAWWPILIPLILLGTTYWLNLQVRPLDHKIDPTTRHDVDFVIDNVSAITLNAQGQPRLTMAASKMWHFPDENSTYLQNPLLTSLNPDGSKVVTTAQRGKVLNNGEEVLLYDDVKVIRSDAPNINTSTLSTNFLHVLPKSEKADTNQAVSIVMNNSNTITGIGMEMDLKTRLTKLLSNVKAVHEQIVR